MDSSQLPPAPPSSPQEFTAGKPPATILQANKWTFKELVQRFTGQATAAAAATPRRRSAVPRLPSGVRKPAGFKLARQRRLKSTAVRQLSYPFSGTVPQKPPSPASSMSTAGGACIVNKAGDLPSPASASTMAEEVVMREEAEKGSGVNPSSPSGTNGGAGEPKLLALFPLTSSCAEENPELRDI